MKSHTMIKKIVKFMRFFIGGLCLGWLAGCAGPTGPGYYQPYAPVTAPPVVVGLQAPYQSPRDIYHQVGPSETLWRISKMYDVDMETLMRINHIPNKDMLVSGQMLLIPNTLGPRKVIPLYDKRKWSYIVIHHTATDEGNAYSIDQIHHKRGFWNGMGYHFLIDNGTLGKAPGQTEVGPRWIKQKNGAHCNVEGMNEKGIGIAVVGNYSEEHLSEAVLDSLVYLVKILQQHYDIPRERVIGHRDVKNTECPGKNFPWAEFQRRLAF